MKHEIEELEKNYRNLNLSKKQNKSLQTWKAAGEEFVNNKSAEAMIRDRVYL